MWPGRLLTVQTLPSEALVRHCASLRLDPNRFEWCERASKQRIQRPYALAMAADALHAEVHVMFRESACRPIVTHVLNSKRLSARSNRTEGCSPQPALCDVQGHAGVLLAVQTLHTTPILISNAINTKSIHPLELLWTSSSSFLMLQNANLASQLAKSFLDFVSVLKAVFFQPNVPVRSYPKSQCRKVEGIL